MKDSIHISLLKKWLEIIKELLDRNYNKIKKFVFFSWWASLMFKYSDFTRFSKDLDFGVSKDWKKYDKLFYKLFGDLKNNLEKYCELNEISVYSSFWNWREFIFQWELWVSAIKIDFMYDYVLWYEKCCWLNKISDMDIFINKLQRLNKTDLIDLKFLYKKNKFDAKSIVDWIRIKSQMLYWNPYYLDDKVLSNVSKTKGFNFLNQLSDEFKRI